MKAEKIYKDFLVTAKYLLKDLDSYGELQWKRKIDDKTWTIGQLYDHLINGTEQFHLREIKNCLNKTHGREKGGKRIKGRIMFMMGTFPPVKIKGIEPGGYVPAQPEKPSKSQDELYRFIKLMNQIAKEIDASSSTYKTLHPSLGMLNALEWYKLIEMHFRHHIKQKKRIDEIIRSSEVEEILD